jgi:hypothetical protein
MGALWYPYCSVKAAFPFPEVRTLASVPLLALLDSYLRTPSHQTRQLILPRQSLQQQKYKKEQETWSLSILDSKAFVSYHISNMVALFIGVEQ